MAELLIPSCKLCFDVCGIGRNNLTKVLLLQGSVIRHFEERRPFESRIIQADSPDAVATLRPARKKGQVVSAEEAARIIRGGDTVATDGFVGACFAEEIAVALEKHFLATGAPRNLTLVYAAGQGDRNGNYRIRDGQKSFNNVKK